MTTETNPEIVKRPFLLNFASNATEASSPHVVYDNRLELNLLVDGESPLASTPHLLSTTTKTMEHKEADDPDD